MADEWIKWCKGLAKKREVVALASLLRRDRHEVAGRLMVLWEWCDENAGDADFDTEGNLSLIIGDNAGTFVDEVVGLPGFANALTSPAVHWLAVEPHGRVTFFNLARHNGSTAKTRAYERRKKARQREPVPKMSPGNGDKNGTRTRGEREENESPSNREDSDRNRSTAKTLRFEKANLDHLTEADWASVIATAELAAKRVPPITDEDRRAWLKYALMAHTLFDEHWLLDAAEGAKVTPAEKVKTTRQAIFVSALKVAAAKRGTDNEEFDGTFRKAEIPKAIWKSPVLTVKGIKA